MDEANLQNEKVSKKKILPKTKIKLNQSAVKDHVEIGWFASILF
jgi:hypothetical protein